MLKDNHYHSHPAGTKNNVSIVKEIVSQNYCQFGNRFYEQAKGLAMGSRDLHNPSV
jgi:hypothetical protein